MADPEPIVIHWFRRDLRLDDNHALFEALNSGLPVLPVFIFDKEILDRLQDRNDARVTFIHNSLSALNQQLKLYGSGIKFFHGNPVDAFRSLTGQYRIHAVYTNHDYEPYSIKRDKKIENLLIQTGISFHSFKDQVLFEKNEVVKEDGKPYTVYTPYSRKWFSRLNAESIPVYPSENKTTAFLNWNADEIPGLQSLGFNESVLFIPPAEVRDSILHNYKLQRDFPAVSGTTRISVHLRFGTVSIRKLVQKAQGLSTTFLNELCWREFYMMILWQSPHVATSAFKTAYDRIKWRNDELEFECWKAGKTGFPIVDAGMRELAATGFMHNRVRMIVASFLTKHLLIDWRWGEAWFAEKLLDFELASNNGGWQWAAGSGCDAAPYFRIFNPYEQTRKFDPELKYIRTWIPELDEASYPQPIVDHKEARERCLRVYSQALKP